MVVLRIYQRRPGEEMISMTDKNSIRLLWRQGDSVAEIARKTGVSRDTVYKYRDMDDFSPEPPARRAQGSKLDPYRPLIESWLDDDMRSGRKQRHTAKRVHDRLVSECGADVSVSTVERCVREIRARRSVEAADAQYLDLVWGPGEAQADFGEADFYVRGMRTTLSFFVMTFPYSNVGLAQVFPGETSECVCQALRNVFEHVGGVPTKIVFDNATGVGRRVGGGVRTTELFAACSAHYGFRFRFCNPRSGNEKGSVENKVGCVRRNLFVPVPQLWDAGAFNRRLLERSLAMSDKPHLLASIYFSPFSPTYFRQSRQRGCAGFANADAPLSASRLPPPSRPRRRWIRPSGGTTVPLS